MTNHSQLQPNVWHGSRFTGGLDSEKGTGAVDGQIWLSSDTDEIYYWKLATTEWVKIYPPEVAPSTITVEEVDTSPTSAVVTKIVFPNGTLSIVGGVATYTPAASSIDTLAELTDVDLTGLADGKMLQYDSTPGEWVVVDPPSGSGYTSPRCSIIEMSSPLTMDGDDTTALPFGTEVVDELSCFNSGSSTTRFVNNDASAVRWKVSLCLNIAVIIAGTPTAAETYINVYCRKNGSTFIRSWIYMMVTNDVTNETGRHQFFNFTVDLDPTDYIEMFVVGALTSSDDIIIDSGAITGTVMEIYEA